MKARKPAILPLPPSQHSPSSMSRVLVGPKQRLYGVEMVRITFQGESKAVVRMENVGYVEAILNPIDKLRGVTLEDKIKKSRAEATA